ncbi:ethanolamine ammonia-lyase small subunit [Natronocella acetinitrilica]|uniref:Ethanolamine ammonia-lyase small subunit n=1 Tax=Natronocella acetinitrilica TaxID=414046 RepID=A0AAE3G1V7_9GAMM|nr:ethanolamine ammonia-lyase subunit EutC [Natronocella acetinitrilica]MCP1674034.1 ethanolamine ammonia-lyase small subunit [Natronocella acetinitrilica]
MSENGDEPWRELRRFTDARIGMGRSGNGLPTRHWLDFRLAHAMARDSVHGALDVAALEHALQEAVPACETVIRVRSQAVDRPTYLQRPDLGRLLDPQDAKDLVQGNHEVVIVVADGLSAAAAMAVAPPLLAALVPLLEGWRIAPLVVAQQARVALGDPIGEALGARLAVMLIGERPGLSSPASLGAYLTWNPRPGRQNHQRNCISNIRPDGLPPEAAAHRIAALMKAARQRQLTGVKLKDTTREISTEATPGRLDTE